MATSSSRCAQLLPTGALALALGGRTCSLHLVNLARRLPEEQVGADGRAENRDDDADETFVQLEVRDEGRLECCHQRRVHDDDGDDVGEERQREVLEAAEDHRVRQSKLHEADEQSHRQEEPRGRDVAPGQQRPSGGHSSEVGADIDRVGAEDENDAQAHQDGGKLAAQRGTETDPGLQSDPGTGFLDGNHQREGEDRKPERAEPELAPRLRVGPDSGRVVVGGTGDQTGAEQVDDAGWSAL